MSAAKMTARERVQATTLPDDPRAYLDEFQTAKLRGCSVHKLRRDRCAGGGVPFIRVGGLVRYQLATVLNFDQKHQSTNTTDNPKPWVQGRIGKPALGGTVPESAA